MASTLENDLNPNTHVGLSFPLGYLGKGMFNRTKTLAEQARHNMKNLLLTNLGERPHQPEFGSRLLEVVFEFKDDALIEQVINEAVDKWLPYVIGFPLNLQFHSTLRLMSYLYYKFF